MPFWSRKAKDPVCGMAVDKEKAAAAFDYKRKNYYFCAPGCRTDFINDPQKYLKGGS